MTLQNGLLEYLFPNGCRAIVLFGALFAVLLASYLLGSINSAILFSKLIYKILCFFWKLFGIGKSCECGTVHY